jgi:Zn-dependent peptidase ImmA (M78 family)
MILQEDKIANVFNRVKAVRQYIKSDLHEPDSFVLSVDALALAVEAICDVKIDMVEVKFTGEHIGGKMERYANKTARILVKSGQSPEMMRFIAAKELCHVLIDGVESWSVKGSETIRGLLREWELTKENGNGHTDPANPLQSEFLAEIAAVELLYPFEYRDSDISKINNNVTSVTRIALEHEAPAFAIDQALSHHESFRGCWDAVGQD